MRIGRGFVQFLLLLVDCAVLDGFLHEFSAGGSPETQCGSGNTHPETFKPFAKTYLNLESSFLRVYTPQKHVGFWHSRFCAFFVSAKNMKNKAYGNQNGHAR